MQFVRVKATWSLSTEPTHPDGRPAPFEMTHRGFQEAVQRLEEANQALLDFMQERWKGTWPILYGDQLRQVRFDDWVFQGVLDVEHAPGASDGNGAVENGDSADAVAAARRS